MTCVQSICMGKERIKGDKQMKDVKGTIIRIIAEYLDKEESEIKSSDTFTDIGLDSLDIMELVMQMQEELDCKIELSQEITTIDKLVELIEKQ
ncbi:acyl carrier protein [Butyrivibrio sp. XB500-5]|nr:acyl carrier protein [Butyrivibrio sp. XB500-5]